MIHKFSMNGYNIALDVNGGSVHVVDEVAYALLDLYKENTKDEIINILKEKNRTIWWKVYSISYDKVYNISTFNGRCNFIYL